MEINFNTKLSELTVGELLDLLRGTMGDNLGQSSIVHGIAGLADLFGVSYTQAKRIKASGLLDSAISQRGRTILVDREKALRLWATGRRSHKSI